MDASYTTVVAPLDANGLAFARSPAQIKNIVMAGASMGMFFPQGFNTLVGSPF